MNPDLEDPGLLQSLRIGELQTFVERLMFHEVLKDDSVLPTPSRLQMTLGALILCNVGLAQVVSERILGAMVLLYHGLSMHDTIADAVEPQPRKGQLSILGGDYLSSLFYKLLADAGRMDLIRTFAQAIARINMSKMSLYKSFHDNTYGECVYVSDLRVIHGSLLETLCGSVSCDELTKSLVDVAITALVYDREVARGRAAEQSSLTNILLFEACTPEERSQIMQVHQGSASLEKRVLSLHAKYGTFAKVFEGFRESMLRLRAAACERFGAEGWSQLEPLFQSAHHLREDGRPIVEGG